MAKMCAGSSPSFRPWYKVHLKDRIDTMHTWNRTLHFLMRRFSLYLYGDVNSSTYLWTVSPAQLSRLENPGMGSLQPAPSLCRSTSVSIREVYQVQYYHVYNVTMCNITEYIYSCVLTHYVLNYLLFYLYLFLDYLCALRSCDTAMLLFV